MSLNADFKIRWTCKIVTNYQIFQMFSKPKICKNWDLTIGRKHNWKMSADEPFSVKCLLKTSLTYHGVCRGVPSWIKVLFASHWSAYRTKKICTLKKKRKKKERNAFELRVFKLPCHLIEIPQFNAFFRYKKLPSFQIRSSQLGAT